MVKGIWCDCLLDWLICCLLAGPDLCKRLLLKCSITIVFTCPLLSWILFFFLILVSNPFKQNNKRGIIPVSFTYLHTFAQSVVYPPSRIVSHPKDKSCLNSNRSSTLQEGGWPLVEEESSSRESFDPFLY